MSKGIRIVLTNLLFVFVTGLVATLIFQVWLGNEKFECGFGLIPTIKEILASNYSERFRNCEIITNSLLYLPLFAGGAVGLYFGIMDDTADDFAEGVATFFKYLVGAAILGVLASIAGFLIAIPFALIETGGLGEVIVSLIVCAAAIAACGGGTVYVIGIIFEE